MAASLVVQNAYTTTNGNQIVLAIGGIGTSPLSPTSAITGFSVTVAGLPDVITAATSAFNLVTLTLTTAVTSGQAVLVSYSSVTGNLVDSTGTPNTMATFSNTSVTNTTAQTKTTYPMTNANIIKLGPDFVNTTTNGGHTYYGTSATYKDTFTTTFTGTDCLLGNYYPTNVSPVQVSIDGGSYSTLTAAGINAWNNNLVLASGLTDATHTIVVQTLNGTLNIDTTNSLIVYGASPSLAVPTNYGTPVRLDSNSTYILNQNSDWSLTNVTGSIYYLYVNGNSGAASPGCDASLVFRATIGTLGLFGDYVGQKVKLNIDGVDQATVTLPSTGWGPYVMATGLDSTAQHTYILTGAFTTGGLPLFQLFTSGGTGINLTSAPPAYPKVIAWYGDSITAGYSDGASDSTTSFAYQVAVVKKGWRHFNRGYGGSTVHNFGSGIPAYYTQSGEYRTAQLTGMNPAPNIVVIEYGTNDMGQRNGTETVATFQTSFYNMMNALTTGLPSTTFYVLYILPTTYASTTPTILATWNAAIVAACAALTSGQQAQIILVDTTTSPWIMTNVGGSSVWSDPDPDTVDGLHPNTTFGVPKLITRLDSTLNTVAPLLASAVTGANCATITLSFTTGAPPILPATGVTGFTVKAGGVTRSIASATASGNTVILTMANPILSTDVLTVAYAPGNVTDSSNPTPLPLAAFGATAVTNNSTLMPSSSGGGGGAQIVRTSLPF